jgi:hypothetical protein
MQANKQVEVEDQWFVETNRYVTATALPTLDRIQHNLKRFHQLTDRKIMLS